MGRHRLFMVLGPILGLLVAVPSFAFPWPCNWCSTVPDQLTMVGRIGAAADTSHPFTVVVRNSDGGTMAYVHVDLEFSAVPDVRICTDQGPGVTVDCARRTISTDSDANGVATFHVVGCARNSGGSPESGGFVGVRADGFEIGGLVRVATLDQIGCDGLNGSDLSVWLADFFSGRVFMRSDYDGDGSLGGNDLSLLLSAFFGGASGDGCRNATCP